MEEREPNIVTSGLSRPIISDGVSTSLKIYRLESEPEWSLEVVNDRGTSIVWDDRFETDDLALAAFEQVVADEGMATFLDPSNVVPFRRGPNPSYRTQSWRYDQHVETCNPCSPSRCLVYCTRNEAISEAIWLARRF